MAMQSSPRRTHLHGWHTSHGATMAVFRGWEMPLWYPTGAISEHLAVIRSAGLFDTSHMSCIDVEGPGAFDLLQRCFTRDLRSCVGGEKAALSPGRAVFGAFLNEPGHLLDDSVVFQLALESYLVVVNAGKGEEMSLHLTAHAEGRGVQVTDLTGKVGKMDLQGPDAARILVKILETPERTLHGMSYFSFKGHFDAGNSGADTFLKGKIPVMVSRTGFTGEFGFEIFVRPETMEEVWQLILQAGQELDLLACGLAARDSLRAGAVLPLSGQDMGPWPFINHPWHQALPFNDEGTAFTKSFLGDAVLKEKDSADHTYPFVGYDPRKVSIHEAAVALTANGEEIGLVLTCVADMAIGRFGSRIYSIASPDKPPGFKAKGLSCGFVRVKRPLSAGEVVELRDARRTIRVEIVRDVRPDRTAFHKMSAMIETRGSMEA